MLTAKWSEFHSGGRQSGKFQPIENIVGKACKSSDKTARRIIIARYLRTAGNTCKLAYKLYRKAGYSFEAAYGMARVYGLKEVDRSGQVQYSDNGVLQTKAKCVVRR